jgi:hypothetical protein
MNSWHQAKQMERDSDKLLAKVFTATRLVVGVLHSEFLSLTLPSLGGEAWEVEQFYTIAF